MVVSVSSTLSGILPSGSTCDRSSKFEFNSRKDTVLLTFFNIISSFVDFCAFLAVGSAWVLCLCFMVNFLLLLIKPSPVLGRWSFMGRESV